MVKEAPDILRQVDRSELMDHTRRQTALGQFGGAQVISTVARITFFGHDQAGHEVSVSGNIDVTFANWAG